MFYYTEVLVHITDDVHRDVIEGTGFVKICVQADHMSKASFVVTVTTTDGTAIGESPTSSLVATVTI